jgi:hypothetical protein
MFNLSPVNNVLKILMVLILFSMGGCLKTEPDINANIYRSGVWSPGGVYNPVTKRYETIVRIIAYDKNLQPVEGKETYIVLPDNVNSSPESCFTDKDGACFFDLNGVHTVVAEVSAFIETDDIADSISEASKKTSLKADKIFVEIANTGNIYFETSVNVQSVETIDGSRVAEVKISDHDRFLPNVNFTLTNDDGVVFSPAAGSTDGSGILNLSISEDATGVVSFNITLEGLIDSKLFQIDLLNAKSGK